MNQKLNKSEARSPVFVVGFPRSGTTMLASLLDRHPNIAVSPETRFFEEVAEKRGKEIELHAFVKKALRNKRIADLGLESSAVIAMLEGQDRINSGELFSAIMKAYAQNSGKSRCCEKSPIHLMHVDTIKYYYPDAKIICIVRDGRDAVFSLYGMPWAIHNIFLLSAEWNYRNNRIAKCLQKYPDTFMMVKFEDILTRPSDLMSQLFDFIGEGTNETISYDHEHDTKLIPAWESQWKEKASGKPDKSRVEGWRRSPDRISVYLMTLVMGRWLNHWGYDVSNENSLIFKDRLLAYVKYLFYSECLYAVIVTLLNLVRRPLQRMGIKNPWGREKYIQNMKKNK